METSSESGDALGEGVSRREALAAIRKYTFVAGAAVTVLSAEEAVAKVSCSFNPNQQACR